MTRFGLVCLAVLALVVSGAAPNASVEELLRRGNAAFGDGDYATAAAFYDRAEERATDPGLVAYNKATALYRLAAADARESTRHFRDAEIYYRAAATTSAEPRRSRALFGLGNSLLQARGEEVGALREAIRCYRACLVSPDGDASLAKNARHNLELAKLLCIRALARNPQADRDKKDESDGSNSSEQPMGSEDKPREGGNDPGAEANRMAAGQQAADANGQQPIQTDQRMGGPGTLPPVEDSDKPTPLTPEEASQHLRNAIQEIDRERNNQRLRSARTPTGPVKDW